MLTTQDIIYAIVIPAIVAAFIATLGRWRNWKWAYPIAAGAGFLVGCYLFVGIPLLPPQDGTDWLLWGALAATTVAVVDAVSSKKWGWILGAIAGGVVFLIARPLAPHTVSIRTVLLALTLFAMISALVCGAVQFAERRIGSWACAGALCIVAGGAGVIVLSSNLRIVGIYGLIAAASLGPAAVLLVNRSVGARAVAVVATALIAGILTGGHFYPDPGVGRTLALIVMSLPLLLVPISLIPIRRIALRGALAVALIGIIVAMIAGPIALAAKKAAEEDPYAQHG